MQDGPTRLRLHSLMVALRGTGMELYPRIGRDLDIKTWTNCRMGMMGWGVLILAYALRQHQVYGAISDSMLVSVALMELYIFKFFLCVPAALACLVRVQQMNPSPLA